MWQILCSKMKFATFNFTLNIFGMFFGKGGALLHPIIELYSIVKLISEQWCKFALLP